MEEIPKITISQILKHEEELKQRIADGTVVPWLHEKLEVLAKENPFLYKYMMEHTQKFAMGALMIQDPQAIAVSLALEQIVLLALIGNSYKDNADLKNFTDLMKGWFGNGIKGLEDLKDD